MKLFFNWVFRTQFCLPHKSMNSLESYWFQAGNLFSCAFQIWRINWLCLFSLFQGLKLNINSTAIFLQKQLTIYRCRQPKYKNKNADDLNYVLTLTSALLLNSKYSIALKVRQVVAILRTAYIHTQNE